jgi:enoyl-CoA hydratase
MSKTNPQAVVLAETRGATRLLTLNRPEKRNTANLELQQRLLACLDQVAGEPEIRALVMTGAGSVFSAGGDLDYLKQMAGAGLADQARHAALHFDIVERMLGLEIPVIAAVNGAAVGFAAGLVAMCDIVVMGQDAYLCDPHVKFGLGATPAVQIVWPRLTSYAAARELLMTGRKIPAEEAVRIGLASRLRPTGEELATALEIAASYVELPAKGVAVVKRGFNTALVAEARAMRARALT